VRDDLVADVRAVDQRHRVQDLHQVRADSLVDKEVTLEKGGPAEPARAHEARDHENRQGEEEDAAQHDLHVGDVGDIQDVQHDKDPDDHQRSGDDRDRRVDHLQRVGKAHCGERGVEAARQAVQRANEESQQIRPPGLPDVGDPAARHRVHGRQLAVVQGDAHVQQAGNHEGEHRSGPYQPDGVARQNKDLGGNSARRA